MDHLVPRPQKPSAICVIGLCYRTFERHGFERKTHLVEIDGLGDIDRGDASRPVSMKFDQALGCEVAKRFSKRRRRNSELLGEGRDHDQFTGPQFSAKNR